MRPVSYYIPPLLMAASMSISGSIARPTACESASASSYLNAVLAHPDLKEQIELIAKQQLAQWYTDRESDVASLAKSVVLPICSDPSEDSNPPTVVIYGLPQKDCAHGYSTSGSNANADDYRIFLQKVADAAGKQKIVYILEPDAIGLLADGGCGNANGYAANLGVAINILSQNPNAELYLDVGYWTLSTNEQAAAVATILKAVDPSSKCKGISLNTSNYRSNAEMAATCERIAKASDREYKCIVDTSRNLVTPPSDDWCNVNWAGIGVLPTNNTGFEYISRYVWIKPPGESDGECNSQSHLTLRGPKAGAFFPEHFVQLWDNGVFVQQLGMAPINETANTTNKSTAAPPITTPKATPAATSVEQVPRDVEISSPQAQYPSNKAWCPGDQRNGNSEVQKTQRSTTPSLATAPTSSKQLTPAPLLVKVDLPPTIAVVDALPDALFSNPIDADFSNIDADAIIDTVEHVAKHKTCI